MKASVGNQLLSGLAELPRKAKSKIVLVVGGAGFIGSNLVKKICKNNLVIVVDSLITGNVNNLPDSKGVIFLKGDINYVIKYLKNVPINEIYHLASPASPPKYQKYWLETMRANINATHRLLKLARDKNAKMVFASTSEIYGDPKVHPQVETYYGNVNSMGERSLYDESKRLGETLCYQYHKCYETKIVIARIFNTYGPGMDIHDGRLLTNIFKALQGKEIFYIYGDGSQTRSLCYVDDTVDGLITLMDKGKFGEAYNIGNPREMAITDIMHKTMSVIGGGMDCGCKPLPEDDPLQRCPNINKIKKLGWSPKVKFEEGILKMWRSYEKN